MSDRRLIEEERQIFLMNKLYYGDNLDVLRRFVKDETVDLCCINPPFNSKRNYNQIYNSFVSMTVRIAEIHRV